MAKRIVLNIIKTLAVIAAVVFWLMPLHTVTQVFLCAGSFAIFLICAALSANLDDKKTGYWPRKPDL